jgi:hypothetical protein
MTTRDKAPVARIGLLWRGDAAAPVPAPTDTRLRRIFDEFAVRAVRAEPVVYAEEVAEAVRERLLRMDGVLVWVDPIVGGRERSALDELLREIAGRGVFVSAHPDVIQKMGTKDVLYRTREMPWGTDTHLYRNMDELRGQLPALLRRSGARVLKQNRGSGGNGVWKVELVRDSAPVEEALVRVQHAQRGASVEEMRFADFLERCMAYFQAFGGAGCVVDQPYAERLDEGMVRCYLVHDRVAGFGHHFVTALMPPAPGEKGPPDPPARLYYGPAKPEFARIKVLLESGWIAQMQRLLDVSNELLPVVWDADFLLGPKDAAGEDTYVLCEVNVSGVFPIPDETVAPLAEAAVERTLAAMHRRAM